MIYLTLFFVVVESNNFCDGCQFMMHLCTSYMLLFFFLLIRFFFLLNKKKRKKRVLRFDSAKGEEWMNEWMKWKVSSCWFAPRFKAKKKLQNNSVHFSSITICVLFLIFCCFFLFFLYFIFARHCKQCQGHTHLATAAFNQAFYFIEFIEL